MSDKAVCRTAPATPGLLIIYGIRMDDDDSATNMCMGPRSKKGVLKPVLNFRRVTHLWLCMLEKKMPPANSLSMRSTAVGWLTQTNIFVLFLESSILTHNSKKIKK